VAASIHAIKKDTETSTVLTITAAISEDIEGDFILAEVELDEPRDDEVLVRIEASGVCHTDLWAKQYLPAPFILGHEGIGIIEKTGNKVNRVKPGDRVIISYPWCGECPSCNSGKPFICNEVESLCFSGARLDGSMPIQHMGAPVNSAFFQQSSFATHAITPERSLVPVNSDHKAELLAALPCGVQTGAGAVLNTFGIKVKQGLIVVGTGAVGMSAIMAASVTGAYPVIAIDINESRLALAREMGATHILNKQRDDVVNAIQEINPGGVDFAFETSGTESGLNDAIACIKMGGVCGIVTTAYGGEKYPFSLDGIMMKGASIQGIIQGSSIPNDFLPRLMDLHDNGKFPYERIIKTYKFADINQAVKDTRSGNTIKPVLLMSD